MKVGESKNFTHVHLMLHLWDSLPFLIVDASLLSADLKWLSMSCSRKSKEFNGHLPSDVRSQSGHHLVTWLHGWLDWMAKIAKERWEKQMVQYQPDVISTCQHQIYCLIVRLQCSSELKVNSINQVCTSEVPKTHSMHPLIVHGAVWDNWLTLATIIKTASKVSAWGF